MELIERYLQAVKFWLPREQKDDIAAELSEDIQAQMETREAELGRKLNEQELVAILKQRGSPLLVATRFLPQRSLIGPLLLPVYWFVLKIVAAVYGLCFLMLLFTGLTPVNLTPAFTSFTVVTIIFAALERYQSKAGFLDEWDPRKLPAVRNPNRITRTSSSIELGVNLVFLVLWVSNLGSGMIIRRPEFQLTLSADWPWIFWGFAATALANIAMACANLTRLYWSETRAVCRLVLDGLGAALFCWLIGNGFLNGLVVPGLGAARSAELVSSINFWMGKMFPWCVAAGVVVLAFDFYRIVKLRLGPKQSALRQLAH